MPFKSLRNKLSRKSKSSSPSSETTAPTTPQVDEQPKKMAGYDFTVYKGGKDGLVKSTAHRDALGDGEVFIQITHSGICGTDRFYRGADMVLGHEGVGFVKEVGPGVKSLKVYVAKLCRLLLTT